MDTNSNDDICIYVYVIVSINMCVNMYINMYVLHALCNGLHSEEGKLLIVWYTLRFYTPIFFEPREIVGKGINFSKT